jgi:ABC-2 type transport system ATP-binding protein
MQREFNDFLDAETGDGLTAFLSSHVLSEVRRVCDRVGVLRGGRLVTTERVEDLLDRTGKVVRVSVAGDVDPAAFDIPGAHDVSCSTTDGGESRPPGSEHDSGDGANDSGDDASGPADGRERDPVTECSFTFTGDVNDLLDALAGYRLLDLDIEEAPLEEVFMRFYGDRDA